MARKIRILLDLNILLDVLQNREPFVAESARILAGIETGRVEGLISAHAITTLYYILSKYRSAEQAQVTVTELLQFLSIASVGQSTIEQALALPIRDFEDAVQMVAALQNDVQYIITRDVKDFEAGPLPALQPAEFLSLL